MKSLYIPSVVLLSLLSDLKTNIYSLIRLHFDGTYGTSDGGWPAFYGYPLPVGSSEGCVGGLGFYYGNLFINQFFWVGITAIIALTPVLWIRSELPGRILITLRKIISQDPDTHAPSGPHSGA